ncbi:MAG: hypothetical protein ACR2GK_00390 [Gemmatimonadaceae bacterium]
MKYTQKKGPFSIGRGETRIRRMKADLADRSGIERMSITEADARTAGPAGMTRGLPHWQSGPPEYSHSGRKMVERPLPFFIAAGTSINNQRP